MTDPTPDPVKQAFTDDQIDRLRTVFIRWRVERWLVEATVDRVDRRNFKVSVLQMRHDDGRPYEFGAFLTPADHDDICKATMHAIEANRIEHGGDGLVPIPQVKPKTKPV